MSNRYAIHLETPAGLQFDGMVEADSLYEAAMKWAWDSDRDVPRGAAIVVQDPNYNEDMKLRFTVLAPNGRADVYSATECIYVASEFDPKALFREMAVHYEKPTKEREEFTTQDLKDAVNKLKANAIKPDKDGYYRVRVNEAGNIELVSGLEKRGPAESASLRIWLAKDDADLNKQMDSMSGNWPGASGPYCFDVEIGDGDATIVGGDPDPLYRGEIAAVSKTNKHGAGIRIRRDAQDDYIYIFPSIGAYPKEDSALAEPACEESVFDAVADELLSRGEIGAVNTTSNSEESRKAKTEAPKEDAGGELKIELKEFVVDKPCRYSIWINDREYPNKRAGIVDAISLFDAADKWASGTSGGSRIAIVTADFTPSGYLDFATAVKTDVEGVYVWSDTYRVSEFICHSAPKEILPQGAPQAISYNAQITVKRDSTPDSEECRKQFEQAVMRACRERFDEQP